MFALVPAKFYVVQSDQCESSSFDRLIRGSFALGGAEGPAERFSTRRSALAVEPPREFVFRLDITTRTHARGGGQRLFALAASAEEPLALAVGIAWARPTVFLANLHVLRRILDFCH